MHAFRKVKTTLDAVKGIAVTIAGICGVIGAAYLMVWLAYLVAGKAG